MPLSEWKQENEFRTFLREKRTGFIYKHSTQCSVSAGAHAEVESFLSARPEAVVHRVLVIESRPVSNLIATELGIGHASPQLILVRDGKPVWSASHGDITLSRVEEAWTGHAGSGAI